MTNPHPDVELIAAARQAAADRKATAFGLRDAHEDLFNRLADALSRAHQPAAPTPEAVARVIRALRAEAENLSPSGTHYSAKFLIKQADALQAALLPSPVQAGWRPIESAPLDGTHVLLAFGQDGVSEGWWEDGDGGPYPWKFVDSGCAGSPFSNGETLNGAREVRGGPSHWQPLPAPPSSAAPGVGEG